MNEKKTKTAMKDADFSKLAQEIQDIKKLEEKYIENTDIKVCAICMKEFVPKKKRSLTCSPECHKERAKIMAHFKCRYQTIHGTRPSKAKPKPVKKVTLGEIAAEAREHGMTYGEYVARKEFGLK